MQWKREKRKPRPRIGEVRATQRFAYFPVHCESLITVWLERYTVNEEYVGEGEWYTFKRISFVHEDSDGD